MRALAVYLVVLFHAGVDRFSGGFIGVDVFFVLSGYLVTQVLVRDLARDGSHRLRPLLRPPVPPPAAGVVRRAGRHRRRLIGDRVAGRAASRGRRRSRPRSCTWRTGTSSTSRATTSPPPSTPTRCSSSGRWRSRSSSTSSGRSCSAASSSGPAARATCAPGRSGVVVVAAALASMLWALHLAGSNISRAYYGTDARAYQLLAGALLALSPGIVRRVARLRVTWLAALAGRCRARGAGLVAGRHRRDPRGIGGDRRDAGPDRRARSVRAADR